MIKINEKACILPNFEELILITTNIYTLSFYFKLTHVIIFFVEKPDKNKKKRN